MSLVVIKNNSKKLCTSTIKQNFQIHTNQQEEINYFDIHINLYTFCNFYYLSSERIYWLVYYTFNRCQYQIEILKKCNH